MSGLSPGTFGVIFIIIWKPTGHSFIDFPRVARKNLLICPHRPTIIYSLCICLLFCFHFSEPHISKEGVIWWQLTTPFSNLFFKLNYKLLIPYHILYTSPHIFPNSLVYYLTYLLLRLSDLHLHFRPRLILCCGTLLLLVFLNILYYWDNRYARVWIGEEGGGGVGGVVVVVLLEIAHLNCFFCVKN